MAQVTVRNTTTDGRTHEGVRLLGFISIFWVQAGGQAS
jgi:hypothetical protein